MTWEEITEALAQAHERPLCQACGEREAVAGERCAKCLAGDREDEDFGRRCNSGCGWCGMCS